MKWFDSYLQNHSVVEKFFNNPSELGPMTLIQEALMVVGAFKRERKPIVIVKENEHQATQLVEIIKRLDETLRIVFYNHEESLRVETIVQSEQMQASRVEALLAIVEENYDICITHAIASVRKLSKPHVLKASILNLNVGQEYSLNQLSKDLMNRGYQRVKYVEKPFTFSIRGGVCDIFSIQMEKPLRIEFFDVEIESMRYFDIETQLSVEKVDTATIAFASDVLLAPEDRAVLIKYLDNEMISASEALRDNLEIIKDQLSQGYYDTTLYPILGALDSLGSFFDFVTDAYVLLSPYSNIRSILVQNEEELSVYREEVKTTESSVIPNNVYFDLESATRCITAIKLDAVDSKKVNDVPWHQANIISESIHETLRWLIQESKQHRIIVSLTDKNIESFIKLLSDTMTPYQQIDDAPKENGLYVVNSDIEQGFILEDVNIHVYTAYELYTFKRKKYRYDDKFSKAEVLNQLQDLDTADYVVHRQHGIGRYMGITTKEIDGIHKDFIRILYKDNDELFVPLEQFSLVRKFMSSEGVGVRLSKLGGTAWSKNKARVEANVAIVADKLIDLYSQRMETKGFAFSKDTPYQMQFESDFPYELTPDQKKAVIDIKNDMESEKPMDRLLIGDVGFGKTEVAIRAAFKAFVDKKQVVFLCPTTILSSQHFRTFKKRFENYPIVVEVLNRFVSDSAQKDILRRYREGKVDILVGTHRVLSQDVKAHDLGLLIIDEEQRFGVEHKEKIKEFKVSVDVLSLSATPIPRTLQMSLIGLRSLSQLNTPPSNRLPVMTYVIEKNQRMVYDIISKELVRGGQVFYLFNNVDQIYSVANNLSIKVPNASVAVVHGQMDRYEIEDVMVKFINREFNVLVCTTIIETGIDIPNANTILVDNAHRFGLSQLYQIKGRVGRSDRLAYAYFMVPSKKSLTEIATKRLQAIKEFTQLGSGYKIAMRDLTIRGAGELLGGNQSGFIDTVGIDMYVQLLKEAIMRRQGKVVPEDTIIDRSIINVDGYLPESFVTDDSEKLELYQTIDQITTLEDLKGFMDSIEDRYGTLPQAVVLLLEKKRFEIFLTDRRIDSFKERAKRIDLAFTQEYSDLIDGVHLFEVVSSISTDIKIKYLNRQITITLPNYTNWIQDLLKILESVKEKEQ